jgi:DnaJ-class molecular chaperone
MSFKDYYKILEVNPTASQEQIKKYYRRLALKYHPDKNFGDKRCEVKFKEIKEAYEILSSATSRNNFDYDYKRFYNSQKKDKEKTQTETKKESERITPYTFLNYFHDLNRNIFLSGETNIDKQQLYNKVNKILDDNCIAFLKDWNDILVNRRIIGELL